MRIASGFNVGRYATLVFDCDGVLLNSNHVKTQAFYKAAVSYGEEAAQALVAYHVRNGGISRYRKFEYLLQDILNGEGVGPNIDELLKTYAGFVWQGLLTCEVAPGIKELREATANANWLIVSGGDQQELRGLFSLRGLSHLFDGGIFGSPLDKKAILEREILLGNISSNALFVGDSEYDRCVALESGLDFLFVSAWSECSVEKFSGFKSVRYISDLLESGI